MTLPETCPFCGSGGEFKNPEKWVGFTCMTTIHTAQDARRFQSLICAGLERTRLLARVAELEARCKRLEEAGDALERDKQTFKKMLADLGVVGSMGFGSAVKWAQAKEAKP